MLVSSVPLSLTMIKGRPQRGNQQVKFACNPGACERCVGDQTEALAGEVVDNRENAEATAVRHLVMDEVEGPAGIDRRLDQDRRPDADGTSPGTACAHSAWNTG